MILLGWHRMNKLPEREHLEILKNIHPFKQQSAFAEVHDLLDETGIKSHPLATCKIPDIKFFLDKSPFYRYFTIKEGSLWQ